MSNAPDIVRFRHELVRRQLTVVRVEQPGPRIRRITLTGNELRGFESQGFDDHIKLFFPASPATPSLQTAAGPDAKPIMRDFTPRSFNADACELTIDFFLHDEGPASTWAAQASPGQAITIGGPKGSSVISTDGIDMHLLVGDETALPAIGRRLEELSTGLRALVVVECEHKNPYPLTSKANVEIVWVPKDHSTVAPGEQLINALRTLSVPNQRCFAWVACETQAARAIRRYLTDDRDFAKTWIKAAGYWQRGTPAAHEVIQD